MGRVPSITQRPSWVPRLLPETAISSRIGVRIVVLRKRLNISIGSGPFAHSLIGLCSRAQIREYHEPIPVPDFRFPSGRVSRWAGRAGDEFDVIIAGGSTAAFAAAVAAAEEGARTCLIEPTNWVGGQLTSSGVPAVDEAWHTIIDPKTKKVAINVAAIARKRENMTPNFKAMLDAIGPRGGAWVSDYCFEPKEFIDTQLTPLERRLDRLVVLRNTVVKKVETDLHSHRIRAITVIQRTPKPGLAWDGYDRLPSKDLPDWYRLTPSDRFEKRVLTLSSGQKDGGGAIFIDATEWGEVLALVGSSYLQGVETVDGGVEGNDRCGQATVFGLVEKINAGPVDEPPTPKGPLDLGFGDYSSKPDAWALIWTYRRLKNFGEKPTIGDLSLQNWGYSRKSKEGGNDYPFGYLFKSKAATSLELQRLAGGSRPRRDGCGRTSSPGMARLVQGPYAQGDQSETAHTRVGSSGNRTRPGETSLHPRHETVDRDGWLSLENL